MKPKTSESGDILDSDSTFVAELLSDSSSRIHLERDHCSQEYRLPLGVDQVSSVFASHGSW